jgi:hypothetical protein
MTALQAELSPIAMSLRPSQMDIGNLSSKLVSITNLS